MKTLSKLEEEIIQKAKELADFTKPSCGRCRLPHSCCETMHCEEADRYALEEWGIDLPWTDNEKLPFLGPDGCTVPPHLRPICTVHVCESHYQQDPEYAKVYFTLRGEYAALLLEREKKMSNE